MKPKTPNERSKMTMIVMIVKLINLNVVPSVVLLTFTKKGITILNSVGSYSNKGLLRQILVSMLHLYY